MKKHERIKKHHETLQKAGRNAETAEKIHALLKEAAEKALDEQLAEAEAKNELPCFEPDWDAMWKKILENSK